MQFISFGFGVADDFFHTAAFVGKYRQGIADGCIAVGMVVHGVADDVGTFGHQTVVVDLIKCPHDAPLYRFQAVIHIGNGARTDNVTGVIKEVPVHHLPEKVIAALFLLCQYGGVILLVEFIRRHHLKIIFITHNQRPPDCS